MHNPVRIPVTQVGIVIARSPLGVITGQSRRQPEKGSLPWCQREPSDASALATALRGFRATAQRSLDPKYVTGAHLCRLRVASRLEVAAYEIFIVSALVRSVPRVRQLDGISAVLCCVPDLAAIRIDRLKWRAATASAIDHCSITWLSPATVDYNWGTPTMTNR